MLGWVNKRLDTGHSIHTAALNCGCSEPAYNGGPRRKGTHQIHLVCVSWIWLGFMPNNGNCGVCTPLIICEVEVETWSVSHWWGLSHSGRREMWKSTEMCPCSRSASSSFERIKCTLAHHSLLVTLTSSVSCHIGSPLELESTLTTGTLNSDSGLWPKRGHVL